MGTNSKGSARRGVGIEQSPLAARIPACSVLEAGSELNVSPVFVKIKENRPPEKKLWRTGSDSQRLVNGAHHQIIAAPIRIAFLRPRTWTKAIVYRSLRGIVTVQSSRLQLVESSNAYGILGLPIGNRWGILRHEKRRPAGVSTQRGG